MPNGKKKLRRTTRLMKQESLIPKLLIINELRDRPPAAVSH